MYQPFYKKILGGVASFIIFFFLLSCQRSAAIAIWQQKMMMEAVPHLDDLPSLMPNLLTTAPNKTALIPTKGLIQAPSPLSIVQS
jgi:hypothetical protein